MERMAVFRMLVCVFLLGASVANAQELLLAAKKDGKWGYINVSGIFEIPPTLEEAYPFIKGLAVAKNNEGFGLMDTRGKWVFTPRKGPIQPEVNNNRIVLANDLGKWGAMDLKGKTHVPFEYDAMQSFQNGLAVAGIKTSKAGLHRVVIVDTLGRSVIAFDNIYLPANATRYVREGYITLLVDGQFSDRLIKSPYELEGRTLYFAVLDVKNKRLVSAKVSSMTQEVREGRLNLALDGITYSWAVPLPVDMALAQAKFSFLAPAVFSFSGGIAAVHKNGKWAFIDKDGSLLSETNLSVDEYTNEQPMYFGGFVLFKKKNGLYIFTDLNGNQKIPLELETATPFQYGFSIASKGGKYGLLLKDGSWAVQPAFEALRY